MKMLEFLIPSYKRPKSLQRAVASIAEQIAENELQDRVMITVVDDCSPNVTAEDLSNQLTAHGDFVFFRKNQRNKGMSANIRDMVFSSEAYFCCVLTDDDCLQKGVLKSIVDIIESIAIQAGGVVGSFYVPRYSYLEDGSLHCVVSVPFGESRIIEPGPLSSLKYLHDGFILTGLFFQPRLVNVSLWEKNTANSFFPVIYFSDLLAKHKCAFFPENWFVHTVLNECHWEAWGSTERIRKLRLYRDYMEAVSIAATAAFKQSRGLFSHFALLYAETQLYRRQMRYSFPLIGFGISVNSITERRISYWIARSVVLLVEAARLVKNAALRSARMVLAFKANGKII